MCFSAAAVDVQPGSWNALYTATRVVCGTLLRAVDAMVGVASLVLPASLRLAGYPPSPGPAHLIALGAWHRAVATEDVARHDGR